MPSLRVAAVCGLIGVLVAAGCDGSGGPGPTPAETRAPGSASASGAPVTSTAPTTVTSTERSTPSTTGGASRSSASYSAPPLPVSAGAPRALPLPYSTGAARQVLVVTVASAGAEVGSIQGWARSGTGWVPVTRSARASVGRAGVTAHPREGFAASPQGSFGLTQAFGRRADPGTAMPYFRTTDADWWISQAGPLYNTHQSCLSSCAFTTGSPNTRLARVIPQYDYALVIDYNRFPVRPDAGSAFFVHVTRGLPTAGCVSTDEAMLALLLRWLQPAAHPRILIGVSG